MRFGAQLSLLMKRELKLSDSGLLTLLIKVVEKGETSKALCRLWPTIFGFGQVWSQKVFLFTFVTPDKSKSPRGLSGGLMKVLTLLMCFNPFELSGSDEGLPFRYDCILPPFSPRTGTPLSASQIFPLAVELP